MAENGKRLQKILEKGGLKGQLKQVGSLDEAYIVLVLNPVASSHFLFVSKEDYKKMLENEVDYYEGKEIYFLVSTNPRDKKRIACRLLTNKFGTQKRR